MNGDGFNDGSLPARKAKQLRDGRVYDRLGELDVSVALIKQTVDQHGEKHDEILAKLRAYHAEVIKMREQLAGIKGIWVGVAMCLTVVGTALALFRTQISSALAKVFQ